MRKTELENCPQWLLDAHTENENVEIVNGNVVWHSGTWHSGTWDNGTWHSGTWHSGLWNNGTWHHGTWHHGTWNDGTWNDGTWKFGTWVHGTWNDGIWHGGIWHSGIWNMKFDRLLFMASMLGIVFNSEGYAVAYRTTKHNGCGKWNSSFIQPEGEWYEECVPLAGSGTCVRGIHVGSIATALTYFKEIDDTAQLWQVRFKRKDLLDCDGEKARIRGGIFTKIDNPFLEVATG